MIDVITKPALQELKNPSNMKLLSASDIRPPQCFHSDSFYLCSNDLYFFQRNAPLEWKKESQLPFQKRQGQSMTSTPSGIAFFGGQNDLSVYNDLWIFDKGGWSYVTCDIPSRANHAAACDKYGRLVICGGTTEDQAVLHDLYVIDLKTQKVKELKIPNLPPVSYQHSLTLLPDGTFVLFGGEMKMSSDNKVNSFEYNMYILDLEKKTVKKIETDFQNKIDTHFTAVIYGMLFVFGSSDRQVWMFNFDHEVWIPLSLPKFNNILFKPFYVFSSYLFTENKCLHLVSEDFTKLATVPVFGEPPPSDLTVLKNHPHFIHFLRTNLVNAQTFFNKYEPTTKEVLPEKRTILDQARSKLREKNKELKIVNDKSVENVYKLIDTLNAMEYLMLHANKVQKLMEFTSNNTNIDLSTNKEKEKNAFLRFSEDQLNELISVHQVIIDIQNLMILRSKEMTPLNEQCESLINEIENSTFSTFSEQFWSEKKSPPIADDAAESQESPLLASSDKKKKKKSSDDSKRVSRHEKRSNRHVSGYGSSKRTSSTFEKLAEDSKQLAHTISFERQRYENELKSQNSNTSNSNNNEKSTIQKNEPVLNVLDQLCSVSQREIQFMSQLRPVCYEFFDVLSDLTKLRESELMIDNETARSLSSKLSKNKTDEKTLIKLKEQLESAFKDLKAAIDEVQTIGDKSHKNNTTNNNNSQEVVANQQKNQSEVKKSLSFEIKELLGSEEADDDELLFVSKQKLRLENQIQLQKPLRKVEKSISKIGQWMQNADPIIGQKTTKDLVNATYNSFKGNFNSRIKSMYKPERTTSTIEVPKFKQKINKGKIDRAVSDSIYAAKKTVSNYIEEIHPNDENLADFFTPFNDSQGDEIVFVDDLEKVFTRIEANIYKMNPLSKF